MNEQIAIRILKRERLKAREGTFQAYKYKSCYSWIMQIEDEDGCIALGWEETFVLWPLVAVPALVKEMLAIYEQSRAPELTIRESFLLGNDEGSAQ